MPQLRFGDTISLVFSSKYNLAYSHSECGLVEHTLTKNNNDNILFRDILKTQWIVLPALSRSSDQSQVRYDSKFSGKTKSKHLQQLESIQTNPFFKEKEMIKNRLELAIGIGTPVLYGQPVQLQFFSSPVSLSLERNSSALQVTANVTNSFYGSGKAAYFEFFPLNQALQPGDPVSFHDSFAIYNPSSETFLAPSKSALLSYENGQSSDSQIIHLIGDSLSCSWSMNRIGSVYMPPSLKQQKLVYSTAHSSLHKLNFVKTIEQMKSLPVPTTFLSTVLNSDQIITIHQIQDNGVLSVYNPSDFIHPSLLRNAPLLLSNGLYPQDIEAPSDDDNDESVSLSFQPQFRFKCDTTKVSANDFWVIQKVKNEENLHNSADPLVSMTLDIDRAGPLHWNDVIQLYHPVLDSFLALNSEAYEKLVYSNDNDTSNDDQNKSTGAQLAKIGKDIDSFFKGVGKVFSPLATGRITGKIPGRMTGGSPTTTTPTTSNPVSKDSGNDGSKTFRQRLFGSGTPRKKLFGTNKPIGDIQVAASDSLNESDTHQPSEISETPGPSSSPANSSSLNDSTPENQSLSNTLRLQQIQLQIDQSLFAHKLDSPENLSFDNETASVVFEKSPNHACEWILVPTYRELFNSKAVVKLDDISSIMHRDTGMFLSFGNNGTAPNHLLGSTVYGSSPPFPNNHIPLPKACVVNKKPRVDDIYQFKPLMYHHVPSFFSFCDHLKVLSNHFALARKNSRKWTNTLFLGSLTEHIQQCFSLLLPNYISFPRYKQLYLDSVVVENPFLKQFNGFQNIPLDIERSVVFFGSYLPEAMLRQIQEYQIGASDSLNISLEDFDYNTLVSQGSFNSEIYTPSDQLLIKNNQDMFFSLGGVKLLFHFVRKIGEFSEKLFPTVEKLYSNISTPDEEEGENTGSSNNNSESSTRQFKVSNFVHETNLYEATLILSFMKTLIHTIAACCRDNSEIAHYVFQRIHLFEPFFPPPNFESSFKNVESQPNLIVDFLALFRSLFRANLVLERNLPHRICQLLSTWLSNAQYMSEDDSDSLSLSKPSDQSTSSQSIQQQGQPRRPRKVPIDTIADVLLFCTSCFSLDGEPLKNNQHILGHYLSNVEWIQGTKYLPAGTTEKLDVSLQVGNSSSRLFSKIIADKSPKTQFIYQTHVYLLQLFAHMSRGNSHFLKDLQTRFPISYLSFLIRGSIPLPSDILDQLETLTLHLYIFHITPFPNNVYLAVSDSVLTMQQSQVKDKAFTRLLDALSVSCESNLKLLSFRSVPSWFHSLKPNTTTETQVDHYNKQSRYLHYSCQQLLRSLRGIKALIQHPHLKLSDPEKILTDVILFDFAAVVKKHISQDFQHGTKVTTDTRITSSTTHQNDINQFSLVPVCHEIPGLEECFSLFYQCQIEAIETFFVHLRYHPLLSSLIKQFIQQKEQKDISYSQIVEERDMSQIKNLSSVSSIEWEYSNKIPKLVKSKSITHKAIDLLERNFNHLPKQLVYLMMSFIRVVSSPWTYSNSIINSVHCIFHPTSQILYETLNDSLKKSILKDLENRPWWFSEKNIDTLLEICTPLEEHQFIFSKCHYPDMILDCLEHHDLSEQHATKMYKALVLYLPNNEYSSFPDRFGNILFKVLSQSSSIQNYSIPFILKWIPHVEIDSDIIQTIQSLSPNCSSPTYFNDLLTAILNRFPQYSNSLLNIFSQTKHLLPKRFSELTNDEKKSLSEKNPIAQLYCSALNFMAYCSISNRLSCQKVCPTIIPLQECISLLNQPRATPKMKKATWFYLYELFLHGEGFLKSFSNLVYLGALVSNTSQYLKRLKTEIDRYPISILISRGIGNPVDFDPPVEDLSESHQRIYHLSSTLYQSQLSSMSKLLLNLLPSGSGSGSNQDVDIIQIMEASFTTFCLDIYYLLKQILDLQKVLISSNANHILEGNGNKSGTLLSGLVSSVLSETISPVLNLTQDTKVVDSETSVVGGAVGASGSASTTNTTTATSSTNDPTPTTTSTTSNNKSQNSQTNTVGHILSSFNNSPIPIQNLQLALSDNPLYLTPGINSEIEKLLIFNCCKCLYSAFNNRHIVFPQAVVDKIEPISQLYETYALKKHNEKSEEPTQHIDSLVRNNQKSHFSYFAQSELLPIQKDHESVVIDQYLFSSFCKKYSKFIIARNYIQTEWKDLSEYNRKKMPLQLLVQQLAEPWCFDENHLIFLLDSIKQSFSNPKLKQQVVANLELYSLAAVNLFRILSKKNSIKVKNVVFQTVRLLMSAIRDLGSVAREIRLEIFKQLTKQPSFAQYLENCLIAYESDNFTSQQLSFIKLGIQIVHFLCTEIPLASVYFSGQKISPNTPPVSNLVLRLLSVLKTNLRSVDVYEETNESNESNKPIEKSKKHLFQSAEKNLANILVLQTLFSMIRGPNRRVVQMIKTHGLSTLVEYLSRPLSWYAEFALTFKIFHLFSKSSLKKHLKQLLRVPGCAEAFSHLDSSSGILERQVVSNIITLINGLYENSPSYSLIPLVRLHVGLEKALTTHLANYRVVCTILRRLSLINKDYKPVYFAFENEACHIFTCLMYRELGRQAMVRNRTTFETGAGVLSDLLRSSSKIVKDDDDDEDEDDKESPDTSSSDSTAINQKENDVDELLEMFQIPRQSFDSPFIIDSKHLNSVFYTPRVGSIEIIRQSGLKQNNSNSESSKSDVQTPPPPKGKGDSPQTSETLDQSSSSPHLAKESVRTVFFVRPRLVKKYLRPFDKHDLNLDLKRSTPTEKIQDFHNKILDIYHRCLRRENIHSHNFRRKTTDQSLVATLEWAMFGLSLFLNFFLIFTSPTLDEKRTSGTLATLSTVGFILLAVCCILFYSLSLSEYIVKRDERARHWLRSERLRLENNLWEPKSFYQRKILPIVFFFDWKVLYMFFACVCAFLGVIVSPYFFAYHMIGVVSRSSAFATVAQSVIRNIGSVGITAVIALVSIYFFSIWAWLSFQNVFNDETDNLCDGIIGCSLAVMSRIPSGEAFGAITSSGELTYHVLFFLIIAVILISILTGIIIDTFAQLRIEREAKIHDMVSKCCICGIDSSSFDRQGFGFENHISLEHHQWDYLDYFVRIKQILHPTVDYTAWREAHLKSSLPSQFYQKWTNKKFNPSEATMVDFLESVQDSFGSGFQYSVLPILPYLMSGNEQYYVSAMNSNTILDLYPINRSITLENSDAGRREAEAHDFTGDLEKFQKNLVSLTSRIRSFDSALNKSDSLLSQLLKTADQHKFVNCAEYLDEKVEMLFNSEPSGTGSPASTLRGSLDSPASLRRGTSSGSLRRSTHKS